MQLVARSGRKPLSAALYWIDGPDPGGGDLPQDHFWKTVGFNDYYLRGNDGWEFPLGTVQVIGNYHTWEHNLLPDGFGGDEASRRRLAAQMLPVFLLTEDLPEPGNRVCLTPDDGIQVVYRANNLKSHGRLVDVMKAKLARAGYAPVSGRE